MMKKFFSTLLLSSMLMLTFSLSAFAASSTSEMIEFRPLEDGEFNAYPGETSEIPMTLGNFGETTLNMTFGVQSSGDSGSGIKPMPDNWVSMAPAEIELLPKEQKSLKALVDIPEDASQGIYQAIIVAKGDSDETVASSGGAQFSASIGVKVQIAVLDPALKESGVESDLQQRAEGEGDDVESSEGKSNSNSMNLANYSMYFDILILVLLILLFAKVHALEEGMNAKSTKKGKK